MVSKNIMDALVQYARSCFDDGMAFNRGLDGKGVAGEQFAVLLALIAQNDDRTARLEARLALLEKLEAEAIRSVETFGVTLELHGINSWLCALAAQAGPTEGDANGK